MLLHLSNQSAEPLHHQVSRQIREQILAGDLAEDSALPSIRQLAREQQISVITVQRAYDDLQREGLLIARPGKGFFVAATGEDQKLQLAQQRLIDAVAPLIAEARASGLTAEQIIDLVRRVFEEGE